MIEFPFSLFAESEQFPIHIQYGYHEADDCYLHMHRDFSELVVVLGGRAQHIVGEESYPIAMGDVFVIDPYTAHRFTEAVHLKICKLMFRPEEVFAGLYDMKRLAGFQALFILEPHYSHNYHFCSQLRLAASDFTSAQQRIEEMMAVYTDKPSGWQDQIAALFHLLCLQLSRCYQETSIEKGNAFVKLAGAVAYLENHCCSEISTETLADIAGYSDRQFLRLFQSVFETTPHRYMTTLRMNKAQQLLRSSGISIGEIAWKCGYDDQNYFCRVFRKHTGMTPSAYRKLSGAADRIGT